MWSQINARPSGQLLVIWMRFSDRVRSDHQICSWHIDREDAADGRRLRGRCWRAGQNVPGGWPGSVLPGLLAQYGQHISVHRHRPGYVRTCQALAVAGRSVSVDREFGIGPLLEHRRRDCLLSDVHGDCPAAGGRRSVPSSRTRIQQVPRL